MTSPPRGREVSWLGASSRRGEGKESLIGTEGQGQAESAGTVAY
jgi:hypothetical protein